MATPKKIILDELKSKGLSRIVSKIKSIRKDKNSIRVEAVDLFKQDRETLQALLDTYTQGSFDGVQDLYVYNKTKPEREFSVKYAFLNNEFSEVEREKIKSMLRLKYDVIDDQSSQRVFNRWYDQVVWTKLCELGEY